MLMQNFKAAAYLGISEPQKEALMKTLVLLETGKLEHVPEEKITTDMPRKKRKFDGLFNMGAWAGSDKHHCGTVCCIGGTAELVGNVEFGTGFASGLHSMPKLRDLFCPDIAGVRWENITIPQAAVALRSYLTTGDARWDLAVA